MKDKRQKKQTNKQKNKERKEQGGTEAIVKKSELIDLVVRLSYVFSN